MIIASHLRERMRSASFFCAEAAALGGGKGAGEPRRFFPHFLERPAVRVLSLELRVAHFLCVSAPTGNDFGEPANVYPLFFVPASQSLVLGRFFATVLAFAPFVFLN